jgi:hypothetical protein
VASLTGDATIGTVMVRRENAAARACRCRSWRERWHRWCARFVDCICETSVCFGWQPRLTAAASSIWAVRAARRPHGVHTAALR